MGKWNYRRRWTPKNYYRDRRLPSPPTYYDTEFKLRGTWKNVDLPWEERFCISVGIPWEKVVTAKKYMYCHDNVAKWDDSAGEITFRDAKERFWAKINGIPSNSPQPDPDMYIDEIDWNPEIDPELVKDLDQAYFNPDETVEKFDDAKKKGDGLVAGCILGLDDKDASSSHDPWKSKCFGNKNVSDPWERGNGQDDRETKEIVWGSCADKSRDGNVTWGDGGGGGGSWHKAAMWDGGVKSSWHWNQYSDQRADDSSKNTWGCGGGSNRNSCARNSSFDTSRGRDTSFGRGRWRGQRGSGWGSNGSCRKREDSWQYASGFKNARVQPDDYGVGNRWGTQRTQNRVSFARE